MAKAKVEKPLKYRPYLKMPFPYVGNKQVATQKIWELLDGDNKLRAYTEPFVGSCSVLLARERIIRPETVNDIDGMMVNLLRAMRIDPDGVAQYALEMPVSEVDIHAWHHVLNAERKALTARLSADPDFCMVRLAGACLNGLCTWIGSNFGTDVGPWIRVPDEDGVLVMASASGKGMGFKAQVPRIGDDGVGIRTALPDDVSERKAWVRSWMRKIAVRLEDVRITCGDWKRCLSSDHVMHRKVPHGILLDPPYDPAFQLSSNGIDYHVDDSGVPTTDAKEFGRISKEVQSWCIEHGNDPDLRIVICGRGEEHDVLLQHGWIKHASKARAGYNKTSDARNTEALWASPACCTPKL